MSLLDLILISFSTYFMFSVLAEYSIPNILRRSSLAICVISFINVILVSSVGNLDLIYFSLAAAGIAHLFAKRLSPNLMDILLRHKKIPDQAEHKKPDDISDSPQTKLTDESDLFKPTLKADKDAVDMVNTVYTASTANTVVNSANAAKIKQQPKKSTHQTLRNKSPIATRIVTMQAPMTFNEFYKEAADNKMLLSDELVKRLTGKDTKLQ